MVVVGAGIVGLATARELALRFPALSYAVVDKENTVGEYCILVALFSVHVTRVSYHSIDIRYEFCNICCFQNANACIVCTLFGLVATDRYAQNRNVFSSSRFRSCAKY